MLFILGGGGLHAVHSWRWLDACCSCLEVAGCGHMHKCTVRDSESASASDSDSDSDFDSDSKVRVTAIETESDSQHLKPLCDAAGTLGGTLLLPLHPPSFPQGGWVGPRGVGGWCQTPPPPPGDAELLSNTLPPPPSPNNKISTILTRSGLCYLCLPPMWHWLSRTPPLAMRSAFVQLHALTLPVAQPCHASCWLATPCYCPGTMEQRAQRGSTSREVDAGHLDVRHQLHDQLHRVDLDVDAGVLQGEAAHLLQRGALRRQRLVREVGGQGREDDEHGALRGHVAGLDNVKERRHELRPPRLQQLAAQPRDAVGQPLQDRGGVGLCHQRQQRGLHLSTPCNTQRTGCKAWDGWDGWVVAFVVPDHSFWIPPCIPLLGCSRRGTIILSTATVLV